MKIHISKIKKKHLVVRKGRYKVLNKYLILLLKKGDYFIAGDYSDELRQTIKHYCDQTIRRHNLRRKFSLRRCPDNYMKLEVRRIK
jgi:hypothetical protein